MRRPRGLLFVCRRRGRGVRGDTWRAKRRRAKRRLCSLRGGVLVFSFMQERKRSEKALRSFLPLIIALRRTQEASGTGLLGITAPRGAVPRLWTPALPRVQPPFCFRSVVQWGITPLPFQITGRFTKSVSLKRMQYALFQKCSLHVSALSASPRQGMQRESVRLGPNASLCTHCHDGVVRPGTEHHTTWRERAILIQSHSSWGWPLVIKKGRGVMLYWTELHDQKGG